MAEKRIEFIEKNLCLIKRMMKSGMLPNSIIIDYKIYCHYRGVKQKSKMVRYSETAEAFGLSIARVRNAISIMEKTVW